MESIDTLQPLSWLIKQFAEQHPTLEVAVENRCRHDICLLEHYAHVESGEVVLAPATFEASRRLRSGDRGVLLFSGAGGMEFAAAVELLVRSETAPGPHLHITGEYRTRNGRALCGARWVEAAAAGVCSRGLLSRSCRALSGAAMHGQQVVHADNGFRATLTRTQRGPVTSVSITLCQDASNVTHDIPEGLSQAALTTSRLDEIGDDDDDDSFASACGDWEDDNDVLLQTVLDRPPHPAVPSAGDHVAKLHGEQQPLVSPARPRRPGGYRKQFRITVVNYTEDGLTFPPDYACLDVGNVRKEKTFVCPRQRSSLRFFDDLLFSGVAFCNIGDKERLYFRATNPLIGWTSFDVYFGADAPKVLQQDPKLARANACRAGHDLKRLPQEMLGSCFVGARRDAVIRGSGFEVLVTDARDGNDARATVAVYPRSFK